MNILFDINHPAQVHLFKNFIFHLTREGHSVVVLSRKKDVATILLDHYGIPHLPVTASGHGLFPMLKELIIRDFTTLKLYKKHRFAAAFGTSAPIAHVSLLTRLSSYNFNEDDDDVVPLTAWSVYPFTTKIINPSCLKYRHWKNKRIIHNSYHELAYLHPNNFQPDREILKKYNLSERGYLVLRFSALKAHHDVGAKGIAKELVEKLVELFKGYTIVKSVEGAKTHQIEPWDMHHILAFAKMVISDSQTMTAESAVLGVPSLRQNSFAGRIGYLEELQHKYHLTYAFRPEQSEQLLKKANELFNDPGVGAIWNERKEIMLSEKVDLNKWMIRFFEENINASSPLK